MRSSLFGEQVLAEFLQGLGPVTDTVLQSRTELGECLLVATRYKDRVIAKTTQAACPVRDPASTLALKNPVFEANLPLSSGLGADA